ncbi:hypothetical protein Zm00014a_016906 [Zea mays]|uniref:Uncharacterized protein n=1 Tax=Zea mays TaxID=4577 RepID=A0A3L6DG30_MAIZE|nr:hypothetical protein Zm00014a_016906 [Zea mays]
MEAFRSKWFISSSERFTGTNQIASPKKTPQARQLENEASKNATSCERASSLVVKDFQVAPPSPGFDSPRKRIFRLG